MKVTAIVGTYRKGHIIDSAVDEVLAGAQAAGAQVSKIYLLDKHIEFCTNCRACTQHEGPRGACSITDDMSSILDELEASDAIVLASPMNFFTVTALFKRFIERTVCYAYWPWNAKAPKMRMRPAKPAILVTSSAAPMIISRPLSRIVYVLKMAANALGAKTVGILFMGMTAIDQNQVLTEREKRKARRLGTRLVLK